MDIVNRRGELIGGWDLVPDEAITRPTVRTWLENKQEWREIHAYGQYTPEVVRGVDRMVFAVGAKPKRDGSGEVYHLYIDKMIAGHRVMSPGGSDQQTIICDQPAALELLKSDPRFFPIDNIRPHAVRVTFKNAAGSPTTLFVARQGWSSDGAGGRRVATEVESLTITDGEPITAEQARKAAEVLLRIKAQEPPRQVFAAKREKFFGATPPQHINSRSIVKGISGP